LERTLAIFEKILGSEHPKTATSLYNLGYFFHTQGDFVGARPYYGRALAIQEKVLGLEHPNTIATLNRLASLS
jgi:hypothetical protein